MRRLVHAGRSVHSMSGGALTRTAAFPPDRPCRYALPSTSSFWRTSASTMPALRTTTRSSLRSTANTSARWTSSSSSSSPSSSSSSPLMACGIRNAVGATRHAVPIVACALTRRSAGSLATGRLVRCMSSSSSPPSGSSGDSSSSSSGSWLERMKAGMKQMWEQYWGGTKRLWADARVARGMRRRMAADAHALTRRETRFVRRVDQDLQALVPFFVIFMLPFSAYALPFIIKLFPGLLPSTFNPSSYRIRKMRERQKAKDEAAREVRAALVRRIAAIGGKEDASIAESEALAELIRRADRGEEVRLIDLRRFDAFFARHIDLWDLHDVDVDDDGSSSSSSFPAQLWGPPELRALCKLYNVSAGPLPTYDARLEKLTRHAAFLLHDDEQLDREGPATWDELTEEELMEACDERGLPITSSSSSSSSHDDEHTRRMLQEWIVFRRPPPPLSVQLKLFAPALITPPSSSSSSSSS